MNTHAHAQGNTAKVADADSKTAFRSQDNAAACGMVQQAGNQAIQRMCNACEEEQQEQDEQPTLLVQTKLQISTPDDPYEKQAEAVADRVMRAPLDAGVVLTDNYPFGYVQTGFPSIQRLCNQCESELEENIQAKFSNNARAKATDNLQRVISDAKSGAPLSSRIRQRIEPVVATDLSGVRVHSDARSRQAAAEINAKAFTNRNHIYLGENQSAEDLGLMAHEATHAVQQGGVRGIPTIFRSPLDPALEGAWSFMEPRYRRSGYMQDTFRETLGAATEASMHLQEDVQEEGVPSSDDEKDIFAARMRRLVRLNALGLMASHRATIESRQREAIRSFEDRTDPEGEFDTEVPRRETFLSRIRETGTKVHQLQQLKNELEGYRRGLGVISAQSINGSYFGSITGVYNDILDNTEPHMSPDIRAYLGRTARSVFGESRSVDELRLFAHIISGYLEEWRQGQVNGIKLALSRLYEAYPFFSELDAEDFDEGEYDDDEVLETAVRNAYVEVLDDIDVAIVNIGSGDTHPFDLPEAVIYTKNSLPADMQGSFDEVTEDHQMMQFWLTLGWTFAQIALVFIPVVGPALAAGAGLLDLAMQVEEVMDQYALSDAATNPEGEMLGVSGPGTLDYALLAVTAILTAVDLGLVAREFRAARGAMALDALRLSEGQLDELATLIDDLALDPVDVGRLGTINDETLEMFQRRPDLFRALSDNPAVANLLKHCASPCWPENLESWVVDYLDDFIDDVGRRGMSLEDIGVSPQGLRSRLGEAAGDDDITRIFNELEENLAGVENRAAEQARGVTEDLAHGGESVRGTGGLPNDTIINEHLAGDVHPVSGVPFNSEGYPVFQSRHDFTIPGEMRGAATPDEDQFTLATAHLRRELERNPSLRSGFTPGQLEDIDAVRPRIRGYTWHHNENGRTLQLVDSVTHRQTAHSGGRMAGGGRNAPL